MKISRLIACSLLAACGAVAQNMPADYDGVLKTLDKKGDFKDGVLKVNIPRNDLKVTIDGIATPPPFGFGGWLAMTKGEGGMDVMMGDLVLTEDEVNPVMSALLDNGLEVTAVHNHFFFESPRIFYMHVHGHGKTADLAKMAKPAVDLIGHGRPNRRCPERRCDLRLSIINTLRCPCLDGKSFLDPVVGQGTHQLRDLPIAFEATEFAFRQQQRGASPAFAMVPLSPTLLFSERYLGHREC